MKTIFAILIFVTGLAGTCSATAEPLGLDLTQNEISNLEDLLQSAIDKDLNATRNDQLTSVQRQAAVAQALTLKQGARLCLTKTSALFTERHELRCLNTLLTYTSPEQLAQLCTASNFSWGTSSDIVQSCIAESNRDAQKYDQIMLARDLDNETKVALLVMMTGNEQTASRDGTGAQ